jgi:hypothetical protein
MCGIGDFLSYEALWSKDEKQTLQTIYHASCQWRAVSELVAAFYPNVDQVLLWDNWDDFPCWHSAETLFEAIEWRVPEATVLPRWDTNRPYVASSLNDRHFVSVEHIELPLRYVAVQAHTHYPDFEGRRDLDRDDWDALLRYLRRQNLLGVVLGAEGRHVPSDPFLIDLTRRTSVLESVEVVKAATGYVGIDSWLAIVFAKTHVEQFFVKSVNPQFLRDFYYAPCPDLATIGTSLSFLDTV